jgi:hypothetical protein
VVHTASGAYQYELPFNRIKLDSGLCLAKKGHWAKYDYCLTLNSYIDSLLTDFQSWLGCSRFHKRKYSVAFDMLLANLLTAHYNDAQLLISRDNTHHIHATLNPDRISNKTLRLCCDYLAEKNLIGLLIGKANQHDENASWCVPLMPLIAELEKAKARILLKSGATLVVVRDKDKQPIQRYTNRNKALKLKVLERSARHYYQTWLEHTATLDGKYLLPFVKRIFNESLEFGGRFYGSYQNLSSDVRGRILIDGERTVEPDFKAIHFHLLYAKEGLQFIGDPYLIKGYEHLRPVFKLLCLQLVNVENLSAFKACITRSGDPELQRQYSKYKARRAVYDESKALGLKATKPHKLKAFEGFIEGIPDGLNGEDLLNLLLQRHAPVAHYFGTDRIGLRLQKMDSEVMTSAIDKLKGIPCLPVHDSIRCKVSDVGAVKSAMRSAFKEVTGQSILVD